MFGLMLLDHATRAVAAARRGGTDAQLWVGDGMQHDWPLTLPWLSERRTAWSAMRKFVGEHCAA